MNKFANFLLDKGEPKREGGRERDARKKQQTNEARVVSRNKQTVSLEGKCEARQKQSSD